MTPINVQPMWPWNAMFAWACLHVGLKPSEFWMLSWREWCWLTSAITAAAPRTMQRQELNHLMQQHPDNQGPDHHDQ